MTRKMFIGKPPQYMLDWWKQNYSKTDISTLSIQISYAIDQDFDGNVIQYYDRDLSAFIFREEPTSSLASRSSIAGEDFCLDEISNVAVVYKMSDQFTSLGSGFREASLLEEISASSIVQTVSAALKDNCNLRRACFPKLSSIDATVLSGCLNLERIGLDQIQHIAGLAFSTNANLKILDLGSQMSAVPRVTSVPTNRVSAFIGNTNAVIEAPASISSQFIADQVWSCILSTYSVVWKS